MRKLTFMVSYFKFCLGSLFSKFLNIRVDECWIVCIMFLRQNNLIWVENGYIGYIVRKILRREKPSVLKTISWTVIIRDLGRQLKDFLTLFLYYPFGSEFYHFVMLPMFPEEKWWNIQLVECLNSEICWKEMNSV